MIRHSAAVRFFASMLAVGGALTLALVLSSVMDEGNCALPKAVEAPAINHCAGR